MWCVLSSFFLVWTSSLIPYLIDTILFLFDLFSGRWNVFTLFLCVHKTKQMTYATATSTFDYVWRYTTRKYTNKTNQIIESIMCSHGGERVSQPMLISTHCGIQVLLPTSMVINKPQYADMWALGGLLLMSIYWNLAVKRLSSISMFSNHKCHFTPVQLSYRF